MVEPHPSVDQRREPRLGDLASNSVLVVLGDDGEDRPGFMLGDSRLSLGAGAEDDVYLTGVGVAFKQAHAITNQLVSEGKISPKKIDLKPSPDPVPPET